MMTQKQIIRSLLFWIILLVIISGINATIKYVAQQSVLFESAKINGIMQHQLDAEMMIFGSSVALVHFDDSTITKRSGIKTFNAGTDGANFQQNQGLINEFMQYTEQCKYLVLALTVHDFSKRRVIYDLYKYLPYATQQSIYNSLYEIDPKLMFKLRYIPGYAFTVYDQKFYELCKDGIKQLQRNETAKPKSGWFPFYLSDFDSTTLNDYADHTFQLPVNDTVFQDIVMLREQLRAKGITLVVVLPPIEKGMYPKMVDLNVFRRKLLEMAGDSTCFLDYTETEMCNQRALFYNFTHLNKQGAQVFSKQFATDILRLSHR